MSEMNSEELALKARKTLGTMLDYLGLNAELKAEVTENETVVENEICENPAASSAAKVRLWTVCSFC